MCSPGWRLRAPGQDLRGLRQLDLGLRLAVHDDVDPVGALLAALARSWKATSTPVQSQRKRMVMPEWAYGGAIGGGLSMCPMSCRLGVVRGVVGPGLEGRAVRRMNRTGSSQEKWEWRIRVSFWRRVSLGRGGASLARAGTPADGQRGGQGAATARARPGRSRARGGAGAPKRLRGSARGTRVRTPSLPGVTTCPRPFLCPPRSCPCSPPRRRPRLRRP